MMELKVGSRADVAAQLRQALPLVAVLGLVLAGWFGFNAWRLWNDGQRRDAVTDVRDAAVRTAQDALASAHKRFATQLQAPAVRNALARGDLADAGVSLTRGWAGADSASVLPADLDAAYAALGQPRAAVGYGRLAVMEAALAAGKPTAGAIREQNRLWMGLAAPVTSAAGPAVAFVRLPFAPFAAGIEDAAGDASTYVALRQGGVSLLEQGDPALAGSAEALARPVPGSDLRVAAAVPDVAGGPRFKHRRVRPVTHPAY
ncbi:hypothetical protein EYQ95_21670, partial [Lysobacter sp. N42]